MHEPQPQSPSDADFQELIGEPEPPPLVLVVDDMQTNLQVAAATLEAHGYQVSLCLGGQEACALAEAIAPDLVLLDVEMPDLDGYEVCRRLKASAATRDIPVIFLTVASGIQALVKAFECGGVDYVGKPFHPLELRARVSTHVTLKRARDRERQLIQALRASLSHVKHLKGLIPICASCKKVRSDQGYWQQVEDYISLRSEAVFSHGICPDCAERLFPEAYKRLRDPPSTLE